MHIDMPWWLFSWRTALIALGLYIGFRHSFIGIIWLIPILIGTVLIMDRYHPAHLTAFLWPALIIGVGLYIMFRATGKGRGESQRTWEGITVETHNADYLDSAVVFGGVKKNVMSKNFLGGEAVTVFGGTDINLSQADIQGKVVLELTQIFGGTKLVVPSHWKVQTEDMVAVFGGVEDKRPLIVDPNIVDGSKVLVLKGTCLFGGIDIKSY